MGFFLSEDEAATKQSAARTTATREARVNRSIIDPNAVGCDACPLRSTWNHIATPQMPMTGHDLSKAEILVLSAAPNEYDDSIGLQFQSDAGKLLLDAIPRRDKWRLAFQNMVRCRPDNDVVPNVKSVHACSPYLQADIDSLPNLKAILGVGDVPLKHVFPEGQIYRMNGAKFPVQLRDRVVWYYPILSPEYVFEKGAGSKFNNGPVTPVFESDIRTFFSRLDRWEDPIIVPMTGDEIILPQSYEEALHYRNQMVGILGVDLESNGRLQPYTFGAKITAAAISDGNITISFPVNHDEGGTDWGFDFVIDTVCNFEWVAHNAAMELIWLTWFAPQALIRLPEDSMACVRLYHERETMISLEVASRIHLGVNLKSLSRVDASHINDYPLAEILPYCGLDAKGCVLIFKKLRRHINDTHYERIRRSVLTVSDMELLGLDVDVDMSKQLREYWAKKEIELIEQIAKIPEIRQWEVEKGTKFNIQSAEQVGEVLTQYCRVILPRTKGGKQWKTDEDTLEQFANDHPLAKLVVEHREAVKMDSTYIEPIIEVPNLYVDGKVHPSFTTMIVSTLRLSSRQPNIQNFPGRQHRELRYQIVAPPGYLLVKFDYGQLEVRILAMACKDKLLCSNLINKLDMHAYWRDWILEIYPEYWERLLIKTNEVEPKKVMDGARDILKSDFVFASFYGASPASCSTRTNIPLMYMQQAANELWKQYPGVQKWIKARRQEYQDTGSIRTLTNRVRHAVMWGNEPINCVDYETESLTQRGWVNGADMNPGDVLLTMNPNSLQLEWQAATHVKQFPNYVGEVHHFSGRSFSAVTTPQHRWACRSKRQPFFERTSETLSTWDSIPRIMPLVSTNENNEIPDDWIRLVGWVLTDGSYPGSNRANWGKTCTSISQTKYENVKEIDELIKRLDLPEWKTYTSPAGQVFWNLYGEAGQLFPTIFPDRVLTPEFLCTLTNNQLNILFETMVKGDGWTEPNGRIGFCSGIQREAQIHAFQMLSVLCGRPVSVAYRDFSKNTPKQYESMPNIPNSIGAWYARQTRRENISMGWVKKEILYEQRGMWCPMVPNTFFVARRKGSVYITGNTPIQGTAADVVTDAMNDIADLSYREGDIHLHPRIQIHDDLTFILPDSAELPNYIETIQKTLVRRRYPWQIIPWNVDVAIGKNWGSFEKIARFEGDYYR
jgi:uracil-DNA glycosylase family 4